MYMKFSDRCLSTGIFRVLEIQDSFSFLRTYQQYSTWYTAEWCCKKDRASPNSILPDICAICSGFFHCFRFILGVMPSTSIFLRCTWDSLEIPSKLLDYRYCLTSAIYGSPSRGALRARVAPRTGVLVCFDLPAGQIHLWGGLQLVEGLLVWLHKLWLFPEET